MLTFGSRKDEESFSIRPWVNEREAVAATRALFDDKEKNHVAVPIVGMIRFFLIFFCVFLCALCDSVVS